MKEIIVVSDFDGTITCKDSLVEILNKFASPEWHKIKRLINRGRLGTRIGLRKEFALCRVTRKEFIKFLITHIKIDLTFKGFLKFCERKKIPFLVASGGFGLNIRTIFKRYNIIGIKYYANKVKFIKDTAILEFPPKAKTCSSCSHCKAPYIRQFKKKGYFTVYIGDSVTDRCPAKVADMVFAKHQLAEFCDEKKIAYIPYNTFSDIKTALSKII